MTYELVPGVNCTPASGSEFPGGYFTKEELLDGWIVLNVFICIYTFIALAVVCHQYFVPSLEKIIQGKCVISEKCFWLTLDILTIKQIHNKYSDNIFNKS